MQDTVSIVCSIAACLLQTEMPSAAAVQLRKSVKRLDVLAKSLKSSAPEGSTSLQVREDSLLRSRAHSLRRNLVLGLLVCTSYRWRAEPWENYASTIFQTTLELRNE